VAGFLPTEFGRGIPCKYVHMNPFVLTPVERRRQEVVKQTSPQHGYSDATGGENKKQGIQLRPVPFPGLFSKLTLEGAIVADLM